jgi:hypothetical protein
MFSVLVANGKKEKAKTTVTITIEAIIRIKNRLLIIEPSTRRNVVFQT